MKKFKLRSGNKPGFKSMGSSPAKQSKPVQLPSPGSKDRTNDKGFKKTKDQRDPNKPIKLPNKGTGNWRDNLPKDVLDKIDKWNKGKNKKITPWERGPHRGIGSTTVSRKIAQITGDVGKGVKDMFDVVATEASKKLKKKKSPAKTHEPGHSKKEELLDQGFTQRDADLMIKHGAVTGEVDKPRVSPDDSPVPQPKIETHKEKMKRLSKKYKKTPGEIKKILKSKEYKEGKKTM